MAIHVGAGRGPGHLNRCLQGLSGSPAPVAGDASALAIRDATALNSVNGNGWTADVTFKGMATGGVLDMTGAKALSLDLTRTGFNTAGSAVTFSETIKGSAALRNIAPAVTQQNRASGADVIATAVLRRRVYGGGVDVINSATVPAGAYTVGGTPSNARAISAPANNSTYAVPSPVYGFLVPHHQVRQAAFRFEMVVTHAEARFGQQVACVEFRVRDVATNADQGISVKCGTPELSTLQAQGPKVECYGGTIPIAGLTQGVKYEVYAIIYPWVGAAAFDTRVIGTAYSLTMHNGNATGVRFICDKNGTYGNNVVYVKTGAVLANAAVNDPAKPYPTIAQAAKGLKLANNAKSGADQRNNAGGSTIYLMETASGAGATYPGMEGTYGNEYSDFTTGSEAWTVIAPDPAATGVIKFTRGGSNGVGGSFTKFLLGPRFALDRGVQFPAGNPNNDIVLQGDATCAVWLDGTGGTQSWAGVPGDAVMQNVTGHIYVTNMTTDDKPFLCGRADLFLGNVISRGHGQFNPIVFVGNRLMEGFEVSDANATNDHWVVGWNEFYKNSNTQLIRIGKAMTAFAMVSNVVECRVGGDPGLILFGDGAAANATNFLSFHNTVTGGRYNTCYTTSGIATPGIIKEGDEAYDLCPYWNAKSDPFRVQEGGSDMATRTGNWAWINAVNRRGIVVQYGDNAGNTGYSVGSWLGEVQPLNSSPTATVAYVADKSAFGDNSGGGGNYRLTGATNDAYGAVDQLWGIFRFDLDGNLRRQDGTGAAGAYERP
ncbi:MAG: hypothetical protein EPO51_16635 [Phenylobacterium sp.]|uniref:hypothetical protein n=1 Tax=Phenylobacterium sp. TaxID=1871053 RepID=UPI00121580F2|nr:hypothetical protein [Phenylobacterium sp.]TAJ70715.1 MAG: hypothetical protein EPO51_16635 [Phenylobacterium sp.]